VVFLKITDDTGSSHAAPYPTQAVAEPFNFTSPLSTAFGVIRVKEVSGLVKPARGQYGWIEDLWALVDRAGNLFPYYDEATNSLTADSIVPAGQGTDVTVNGVLIQDQQTAGLNEKFFTIRHEVGGDHVKLHFESHGASLSSFDGLNLSGTGQLLVEVESVDVSADNGDIRLSASGDATVEADSDVNVTAVGDITLTAGAISLVPTTDTTTLKPIRAPGIPAIQAYFTKSDSPITGDLLDSPPVFTRHQEGSELCADLTLACLLPAGAGAITWELNRVVDGVTSTLLSNVFPVIGPGANWRVLTFRVETKLTNTYTITEIERRQTGTSAPNGVPITATPASTCTFTEEDLVGKDVSFQVKVLSSIDQFYAQGTFCLYNPHEQDVL